MSQCQNIIVLPWLWLQAGFNQRQQSVTAITDLSSSPKIADYPKTVMLVTKLQLQLHNWLPLIPTMAHTPPKINPTCIQPDIQLTPIKHGLSTMYKFTTNHKYWEKEMLDMGSEMKKYFVGPMPGQNFLNEFFPLQDINTFLREKVFISAACGSAVEVLRPLVVFLYPIIVHVGLSLVLWYWRLNNSSKWMIMMMFQGVVSIFLFLAGEPLTNDFWMPTLTLAAPSKFLLLDVFWSHGITVGCRSFWVWEFWFCVGAGCGCPVHHCNWIL